MLVTQSCFLGSLAGARRAARARLLPSNEAFSTPGEQMKERAWDVVHREIKPSTPGEVSCQGGICVRVKMYCLLWQGGPPAGCPCSALPFPLCHPCPSPSKAGATAQPLGREQHGGWWAGAPESWGLQPCFNAETATSLNLDQHPRCWYLCWYQIWYL